MGHSEITNDNNPHLFVQPTTWKITKVSTCSDVKMDVKKELKQ